MVDTTQRDFDRNVESSMNLFEQARVGEVAAVQPNKPQRVLLALDGSSQDDLSIAFARHFHDRFHSSVTVVDAREVESPVENLADAAAERLGASALPRGGGSSFQQILDAVESTNSDLAIVPCPFGRDLDEIGDDSTGTVIDVLLTRSPVPLLVVRKPYAPEREPFQKVYLVLIGENEAAPAAASWATGFVGASGRFEMVLVLEEEFYENVRELMKEIDPDVDVSPESLANALERTHVRLHRGLQKAAQEAGFQYEMLMRRENESSDPLNAPHGHPLLVLALERTDHSSEGHVHDRIRRSINPLLVVPMKGGREQ